jgi:O-methyltransferase
MKTFRYNPLQRRLKIIYRTFFPVPKSPWTKGYVENICAVNLVPPETLKTFFETCVKRLQIIKGEQIGDYFEFGVFNGSSLASMYLTAKKLNLDSMRFFGLDAFEGLPEGSEKEDDGVWQKGFYACSFEKMSECLQMKDVNPEDIHWVKGWYQDTLNTNLIEEYKIKELGIIFIDCDTYSSSKTVLDFIAPLITKAVIICLDDWKLNDLDVKGLGEYKSFNEFLEANTHLKAEEIESYNRKSKTFLVTPL